MRHTQNGQTLVIFTIVSAFILLATIALVGNTQVLFVNVDRADAAALLAAQAGASAIDPDALYNNQIVINPAQATDRCKQAAHQAPFIVSVDCTVKDNAVTATVVEQVEMPFPLVNGAETVRARRTARPAFGGATSGGF
jgi:hypothetical protein